MAAKHFYAVVKGRKPGIYTRWSGAGGAEEQVKGYPGAVFKGFVLQAEAELYLRSGGELPVPPAPLEFRMIPPRGENLFGEGTRPAGQPDGGFQAELSAGKVVVFTDGASTGNPGPGGYGVVMLYGKARKEFSAGFRCTTNNRMELLACIAALRMLKRPAVVVIYSDSRYVVDAVQKGWARRWQKNNWMRARKKHGQALPAENIDLWAEMLSLLDRHTVEFRWVRGHASNPENERCDQLAVQAARGYDLPPDPGYRGQC